MLETTTPSQPATSSPATTAPPKARSSGELQWSRPPRKWQAEAAAAWLETRDEHPRQLVHAVMGAGKSLTIEALAREAETAAIVVPRLMLVDQIRRSLQCGEWSGRRREPGPITVACADSLPDFAARPELLVVDEAHRSETAEILESIERLEPRYVLGFSATPYRSRRGEELSAFSRLCYSYTAADALADGVCVPPRVESATKEGESVDDAVAAWLETAPKPAICNARSIADAERYAEELERRGIYAVAVHSRMRAEEAWRRIGLARAHDGTIVHVDMLTEGVDLPWLRSLVLRRATSSPVAFCQYVGRGMRAAEGKRELRVFDPLDLWQSFDLSAEAVLAGQAEELAAPVVEAESDDGITYRAADPILAGIGPGIVLDIYPPRRPAQRQRRLCSSVARDRFTVDTPALTGRCVARAVDWRPVDQRRREVIAAKVDALDPVEAWLKAEAAELFASGALPCKTRSKGWRRNAATPKQQRFIDRMIIAAARHADELRPPLRLAIGRALDYRSELSRGGASDLATVLLAVARDLLAEELDHPSIERG